MWMLLWFLAGLAMLGLSLWDEFRYRERLRLWREVQHAKHLAAASAVAWSRIRAYSRPGYQWRQNA
jgi:hypothetical protein